MPRASTSSDVFNAVAEPQRRAILEFLAPEERPVGDVVTALGLAQPSVSKHLRVLSEVDLVRARRDGRRILYRTNGRALKPLHDWAGTFERYWGDRLRRIKDRAEAAHRSSSPPNGSRRKP
jgi:DNA-binding transcriptional ArsR family regulator